MRIICLWAIVWKTSKEIDPELSLMFVDTKNRRIRGFSGDLTKDFIERESLFLSYVFECEEEEIKEAYRNRRWEEKIGHGYEWDKEEQ